MKSRQYVRLESHRNQEKCRVLKLFRHVCKLLILIVEDRRHVDVPSHSVKFDSSYRLIHLLSWGLIHPFISTDSYKQNIVYVGTLKPSID
jgi:hypothetical protein